MLFSVCTPLGFATLFTILGNYIVRPKVCINTLFEQGYGA